MDGDNIGDYIVSQYNEDIHSSEPTKIIHKVEEYLEHPGAFVESFQESNCQLNSFTEENEEGAPLMSTEEDTCKNCRAVVSVVPCGWSLGEACQEKADTTQESQEHPTSKTGIEGVDSLSQLRVPGCWVYYFVAA